MKILSIIGAILVIAGFIFSLGIVGRVECEDRLILSGEMDSTELISDEVLLKLISIAAGSVVAGGVCLLISKILPVNLFKYSTVTEPLDTLLSESERVDLTDNDFVGTFKIYDTLYELYCTSYDLYVITDVENSDAQYWKGDIRALKALEVEYDY